MKKISRMLFLSVLLVAGALLTGNGKAKAAGGSLRSLETEKTYSVYDITNDGKKDTLLCQKTNEESDAYQSFEVHINGKRALKIDYEYFYYSAEVQYFTLANGRSYLYIYLGTDNDDGPAGLYTYRNGKLKKEADLILPYSYMGFHCHASIEKVSGNKVTVHTYSMSNALASVELRSIYQYKGGKLKLQSKTRKILSYMKNGKSGRKYLTATRAVQLYRDKTLKKKKKKVGKGTKMKVFKCYISGKKISFYVETAGGNKGWFRSPKTSNQPFEEIMYAG